MSELRGNICLHNGPMPGSKAGEGFIFFPSVCLSMIRIIRGELGRECHKCQTVHTEDQRSTCTQWCIVLNWLSVIGGKCTSEREICAFLVCTRRDTIGKYTQTCYVDKQNSPPSNKRFLCCSLFFQQCVNAA